MAEESSRRADDICELKEKSLSARTVGEQKKILQHKKPQPKLGARTANRQFQDDWYAKKTAGLRKSLRPPLMFLPFISKEQD